MILDNENKELKVHQWISKYTEEGKFDLVTGYFTIGALAWLSRQVNDKISDFRLVLGDIVNVDLEENRPLDLLNENISIEAALKLNSVSQEAVNFLKQDKVLAKTLEPNFCHAKNYLFHPAKDDDRDKYFVSGSSNLTEAGIGLKHTNNVELNIAETGNNNQYKELVYWFESLWVKPQAHTDKTIIHKDGKHTKIDFKKYLVGEIEKIFIKYTPREIYYKILFELFGNQLLEEENNPEFNRQIGRLENSVIYNALYEFQKKGVLSLIKMLQKCNGSILADAVGLGKTWSALAVIKYFQLQGREVLLLCPREFGIYPTKKIYNRILLKEERRQRNIDSIVARAIEFAREREASENPVDPDWIVEFFNITQDCSHEKMQYLWAKILAGEVKNPSSFSKRTLNLLKSISSDEAELFSLLSNCLWNLHGEGVSNSKMLITDSDENSEYSDLHWGFDRRDIYLLEDLGLIEESIYILNTSKYSYQLDFFNIKHSVKSSKKRTELDILRLTKVGEEIYSIVQKEMNLTYYEHIMNYLKTNKMID